MKKPALVIISLIALTLSYYNFRAFLPMVGSYEQRLSWLSGWSSAGYYAFNCSGLIAYAHGDDWTNERVMYAGNNSKFTLIKEFDGKDSIDESILAPGDVVVFEGHNDMYIGVHVVAYLGHGTWIDSDSRRGYVTKYRMSQKSDSDPWFVGKARAYRWATPAKVRFNPGFIAQEQEAIDKG